jgi:hypothetical protein
LEFRKGRNGKGTAPTVRLEPRRVGVIVGFGTPDARLVEVREELTADAEELVTQVLRTTEGRVAFCAPVRGIMTASALSGGRCTEASAASR